jgi:hypothetical protein
MGGLIHRLSDFGPEAFLRQEAGVRVDQPAAVKRCDHAFQTPLEGMQPHGGGHARNEIVG